MERMEKKDRMEKRYRMEKAKALETARKLKERWCEQFLGRVVIEGKKKSWGK